MENALANPLRTRIVSWPDHRPADTDAEQAGRPADSEPSMAEDELATR